jgi:hypothetical protein
MARRKPKLKEEVIIDDVPTASPDLLTRTEPTLAELVEQGVADLQGENEVLEESTEPEEAGAEQSQSHNAPPPSDIPASSDIPHSAMELASVDDLELTRQHYQAMNPTAKCIVHRLGTGCSVSWVEQ